MRKLWGLFLCLILFVGCGIDDYVVSRYPWRDVSKIYDRPDKTKIIGFKQSFSDSMNASPITLSDTKLTVYKNHLMEGVDYHYDFQGKVVDYCLSTINRDYGIMVIAVLVKGKKTSVNILTFNDKAIKPEKVEIQVADYYDKIIACYDIDPLRKFVVVHSRTSKKLGILNSNTKVLNEYKVADAIFTDVSTIRQKETILENKDLNYKSTALSFYLASYDGEIIQLYDCDDGKLVYGEKIALSQTGDIAKATMDSGKNYYEGFGGPFMFHLSLYDGKTLFIIDLMSLEILCKRDFDNLKGSLYHCLFHFDEGLYFYDVGKNKLVWLMDGNIRLINSVTVDSVISGIGFYICNDFDNDPKNHFLCYLEAYNFYEKDKKVGNPYLGIKNFKLGKHQVVGDDYETIYSEIVYCRSKILSYSRIDLN